MIHATTLLGTITIGGFNGVAAAFGLIALVQISQFIYYGLDANDPTKGWILESSNVFWIGAFCLILGKSSTKKFVISKKSGAF